jgi:hypothetical protein
MIVPPFHGWMTGPPPPIEKRKKILPFPLSPKPKKGKNCIPSLLQCLLEIFIMGQYPFITGWIPIVL